LHPARWALRGVSGERRRANGEKRMRDEAAMIPSMDQQPIAPGHGSRRDEDIALDMMKFIAVTTGYGKAGGPGAGFKAAAETKVEDYAKQLLELYGQCLSAVQGKK